MSLSKKEVKKIAHLARLELSDAEAKQYQKELAEIIAYIDKLKEVSSKADKSQTVCKNNFRKDKVKKDNGDSSTEIFSTKNLKNNYVKMPSIFE